MQRATNKEALNCDANFYHGSTGAANFRLISRDKHMFVVFIVNTDVYGWPSLP